MLFLLTLSVARAQDQPKICPYDSAHFSWRKPVPRNLLRELQPDRPGVTESPFTVDAGHAQVEVDAFRLSNSGRGEEQRTRDWHLGYTMLKFGLSRRTDIQMELPLYDNNKQRPASTEHWQERHAGFGDIALRVKHNFIGDDQQGHFAMSVIGYVRLPTGGAVGEGGAEYGLILPVDIELGENFNLEAQLESDLNYDREQTRHYANLQPSMALEWDFAKHMGLLTEGFMRWNSLERSWQSGMTVAPFVKITKNFEVDAGTQLALDRRSEHEYFVGFTLRR
ncbi:transporter [Hymenobacter sp. ASUV-10]|uniref:Transporter n=1 Tax=Hymenobacter aranciens TaxID=3063996 RepID=A0ABT9B5J7_9BACT|nr:transporter [Hymenobacter sp. ASUV-10]MDO7873500.1 transporter [Hymenobacter sp. ASUV-10]